MDGLYIQEIPNSHFFSDLSQALSYLNVIEDFDVDYILTGFINSKSNGFYLKKYTNFNEDIGLYDIDYIINVLKTDINKNDFSDLLVTMINMQYNLFNDNLKMKK